MDISQQLKDLFGNRVKEHELMSRHTNFRIGGPARFFVEVRSIEELEVVLEIAKKNTIRTFILGGGSNTLVSDTGFDGMVIQMAMRRWEIIGTCVRAEAGVLSAALARATSKAGLKGLTWAISLPGTIGGAVRGNAGCFGGETRDHLIEAEVLQNGKVTIFSNADLQFGYRESSIKHSNDIVLSAMFELEHADSQELEKEIEQKLSSRKLSQPLDAGSAGCLFKNYEVYSQDEMQRLQSKLDIPAEMSQSRQLSAGWLIDQLDLKGKKIGGAKISEKHGNFVVNTGTATADDVMQLVALVKTRARNEFGIQLEEEVYFLT